MKICVCGYMGTSWLSQRIRWWTRSDYSHVSLYLPGSGREWEAWEKKGCGWVHGFGTNHSRGTVIDVYEWDLDVDDLQKVLRWCDAHEGAGYDAKGFLSFLLRRRTNMDHPDKWFCSEALIDIGLETKRPLLTPPSSALVFPGEVLWSPMLKLRGRGTPGNFPKV